MIIRHLRRAAAALVLVAAPLLPAVTHAGTDTADLAVSASVAANCIIATAPLAFGAYDPVDTHAASPLDATGTVSVTCTDGAAAVIELDGLGVGRHRATVIYRSRRCSFWLLVEDGDDPIGGPAVDSTGSVTYHCTGTFTTPALAFHQPSHNRFR